MFIPFKYILRSAASRRLTTLITLLGIALVVFVFAAVLMMANGVQQTLRSTGSDDNVVVARKAAMSEIMSIIDREAAGIIASLPHVARSADGRSLSSKEVVVIINLTKLGSEGISNVTVRGIEESALQLRPQVRTVEGRMFRWGAREIIVGEGITKRFTGAQAVGLGLAHRAVAKDKLRAAVQEEIDMICLGAPNAVGGRSASRSSMVARMERARRQLIASPPSESGPRVAALGW